MFEKHYIQYFSDFIRMSVNFYTDNGNITNFIVKLECLLGLKWLEVERFDCFHGVIHKDILSRKGGKKRMVRFANVDRKTGLNFALADFRENHGIYVGRFINEE